MLVELFVHRRLIKHKPQKPDEEGETEKTNTRLEYIKFKKKRCDIRVYLIYVIVVLYLVAHFASLPIHPVFREC